MSTPKKYQPNGAIKMYKPITLKDLKDFNPVIIARCFLEYGQRYPCASLEGDKVLKRIIEVLNEYLAANLK